MNTDLKLAVETLQRKTIDYTSYFDYYTGNQPLRYAAERLRQVFSDRQTRFVQNWCAVVVNAILDRLVLHQFAIGDNNELSAELNTLWRSTGLEQDAEAIHRAVLITGEAYVIAWPGLGETEFSRTEAYYHDPRICHLWYDAETPRRKRLGAKWWRADDGRWRINLYYPDRIERYTSGATDFAQASAFQLESIDPNPFGVIPIFHFYRDRYFQQGELINVIPIQDAINKLLGDMMIAAEYGAFRQRWIITNADTQKLRNAPNEIWELPAAGPGEQPTTLGEFSTTDLANYLDAIDRLATSIGVITQTPRHYFFQQKGDPSGEALVAMEAPLIRKVEQYQSRLGITWTDLASFLLGNIGPNIEPLKMKITPLWAPPATIQPRTQAEIRQINVAAGLPLITVLRDEGWTPADLEQLQADREAEAAAQQTMLANAMLQAQTAFDAGHDS